MEITSCFKERLHFAVSKSNLTQAQIARLSGVSRSLLNKYLNGIAVAKNDKLYSLARALNVSPVWLMGFDVSMTNNIEQPMNIMNTLPIDIESVPCLGEISCGVPKYAEQNREVYVRAGVGIKADFCLIARGDSMTGARIYDGDIVFIRKQPIVENGEIAAVIIDDEATLKRIYYYPEKGKLILQAENPAYEPLVYIGEELNSIKILGKAIAFQSDVR